MRVRLYESGARVIWVSVVVVLAWATSAYGEPWASERVGAVMAEIDGRIPALMEEAEVHGLTMAVVEHGELVWSKAYGVASVELDRVTTTETIFEAASLGKVVFALITLRLADQGNHRS